MKSLNAITLGVLIALGGCASNGSNIPSTPNQSDLNRLQAMPSASAIKEAEGYMVKSRQQELDFLTPKHFDVANKALDEAKHLLRNNQPSETVVQKVAVAEAVLKNSERVARRIKSSLADELNIKSSLDELNAPTIYRGEYGSLVARLNEIIRQVEEGKKAEDIAERKSLIREMTHLEAKSIRHNALNEPKEILKRVKYRGGPELAPLTYNEAVAVYNKAEEFITKNPHMREAVEQLAKEALFASKRALYITQEVAALSHKAKLSLEQVVLDEEYRMHRVARAITDTDVRDNPLEVQSELLSETLEEIMAQNKQKDDLVIALRDTLIKVRDASAPSALNAKIKHLKKEKNEWLAKDALYAAKVSQLEAELNAKDSDIALLGSQLDQATRALNMTEMENQALSMTVHEQKQPLSKTKKDVAQAPNEIPAIETPAEVTTAVIPLPSEVETSPSQRVIKETEVVTSEDVAVAEPASIEKPQPVEEIVIESAPVVETTAKTEPVEQSASVTPPMNSAPLTQPEPPAVIDKPATEIIAEIMAEKPTETTIASAPVATEDAQDVIKPKKPLELKPEEAFASGN